MASTCSSGETPSDPAGDLISVDEEVLKQYAEKGQIDLPDKDGKTPLMFACLYGLTDTVQSLLANGANPNSRSVKEGNTPMHYACMVEETDTEYSLSSRFYRPSKWMAVKLAIIKLLVSNGALAVQDNIDGWSPVYVAALYLLTDVVEYLLSMDDISLEVKIKATEILGVSQATLDEDYSYGNALDSFSRAISFQQDSTLPEAQTETSELAECFSRISRISLKECHTQEEINLIEASEDAMKAHAFLVGERVFPNNLKQKYLYPSLIYFICDRKMFEEGFQVLSFALGLGREGESRLASVAVNLAANNGFLLIKDKLQTLQYRRSHARDLLCAYELILSHVPIDCILDNRESLIESFGEILFNEAFYCSNIQILKSTLQAIEKSLRVIQGRILRENPDKYPEMPSVTFKIMELLWDAFVDNMYFGISSRALLRVKFIIFKILFCDNASYVDSSGSNILHLVASCVQAARDFDYLVDLARFFVRHGCPIDVVNNAGETASSILEEDEMFDHESDPEFLMLVSPPTAVLRLEEEAIRAVLRHHINYQGILPSSLRMMIEDGVKECEIERGNEDSETWE